MKNLFMALALICAVGASKVYGDILIEPYVGYGFGEYDDGTPESANGLAFGGRLGFQKFGFMVGAEYQRGIGESEETDGSTTDMTIENMGVFVGYNFPVLLRVYAGYEFLSNINSENTSQDTEVDIKGTATKVGIGFTPLPLVAINLEYIMAKYDKWEGKSAGYTFPEQELSPETKMNTFLLTVSLPLTF